MSVARVKNTLNDSLPTERFWERCTFACLGIAIGLWSTLPSYPLPVAEPEVLLPGWTIVTVVLFTAWVGRDALVGQPSPESHWIVRFRNRMIRRYKREDEKRERILKWGMSMYISAAFAIWYIDYLSIPVREGILLMFGWAGICGALLIKERRWPS